MSDQNKKWSDSYPNLQDRVSAIKGHVWKKVVCKKAENITHKLNKLSIHVVLKKNSHNKHIVR